MPPPSSDPPIQTAMTNEELRQALALLASQQDKLLAKPKRDTWDKFTIFVPLATGLLITITSLYITFRIQNAQTTAAEKRKNDEIAAATAKADKEKEAAEARARVESEAIQLEKDFQQRLARTELLRKMIPFLVAKDNSAQMAIVAVALTKDADMMAAVAQMVPPKTATASLAKVTEDPGATEEVRNRASTVLGDMARNSVQGVNTWGSRALIVALGELKQKVAEDPPGSNRGPRVDEYHKALGFEPGLPWSGIFVAWCFKQALPANQPLPFKLSAGFAPLLQEVKAAGRWHDAKSVYSPKPGDVVLYGSNQNRPPTHGGIVVSVDDSSLTAIEGNTTDSSGAKDVVAARTRTLSTVLGYVDMGIELPIETGGNPAE